MPEPHSPAEATTAAANETDLLQVIRIPLRVGDRWALSGRYVELVWSEIMGPTATLLARRLSDFVDLHPNGGELSVAVMGRTLGVAPSKVRSALSRMSRHGLISLRPDRASVGISGLAPSVGPSRLAELSESAQREHRRQVDAAAHPTPGARSQSGAISHRLSRAASSSSRTP